MSMKGLRGTVKFARSRGGRKISSSVISRIKSRYRGVEIDIPEKFKGEVHGYLRIPVVGEYGIQFLGRVMDMLRRRGLEINGYTIAETVMEEFMGGTEGEHRIFEEVSNA